MRCFSVRTSAAAGGPKELWELPEAGHTGGLDARPGEYERRVVGFFDRYLLGRGLVTSTQGLSGPPRRTA